MTQDRASNKSPADEVLLDDAEAAALLGLSRAYLRKLRLVGGGPPYAKFSYRAVRYRVSDLWAWVDSKTIRSTSERVAA